jgi:hypothetical protein
MLSFFEASLKKNAELVEPRRNANSVAASMFFERMASNETVLFC